MTTFSADWLSLREPHDMRSRNPTVLAEVTTAVADRQPLVIADLACGTGATFRAVSSRFPRRQSWRLVDNDPGLLARATSSASAMGKSFEVMPVDIAREPEAALVEPLDLVTASALLDLVSTEWLDRIVAKITARGLLVYAALTYDGRVTFEPGDELDRRIVEAVNRHQLGDKGFGPALGPTAGAKAIARFEELNYTVVQGPSDWLLGRSDCAIQADLLAGWAAAASEGGLLSRAEIDGWLTRRRDHIASANSSICVGHIDFFARPNGTR